MKKSMASLEFGGVSNMVPAKKVMQTFEASLVALTERLAHIMPVATKKTENQQQQQFCFTDK